MARYILYFWYRKCLCVGGGTRWRSWLEHCTTSRKVAGSIPDGVIGIFHWHNSSGRTMAPGSTQPLTEMSTENIFWEVKAAGAQGWQPYHLHMPTVLKSGNLNLMEPSGPVQARSGIAFRHLKYRIRNKFSVQNVCKTFRWVLHDIVSHWVSITVACIV
jgi:hypothetical protein